MVYCKPDDYIWKMYLSVSETRKLGKKGNPSSPNKRRTYGLPITSPDALPMTYRRFVGARPLNSVQVTNILHTDRVWTSVCGICAVAEMWLQILSHRFDSCEENSDSFLTSMFVSLTGKYIFTSLVCVNSRYSFQSGSNVTHSTLLSTRRKDSLEQLLFSQVVFRDLQRTYKKYRNRQ